MVQLTSDHLLQGPRGRRLCWEFVDQLTFDLNGRSGLFPMRHSTPGGTVTLEETAAYCDNQIAVVRERLSVENIDDDLLVALLRNVVGSARYWQPPDEIDQWLMEREVAEVFRPVATAIASHPLTTWWVSDIARNSQHCIVHTPTESIDYDSVQALSDWAACIRTDTERWIGPDTTGLWWTGPLGPHLAATTRVHPGWGIVGLSLMEDAPDLQALASVPLSIEREARVHEVHSTDDWRVLVNLAPLDVTRARGNDWSRATGLNRQWLVPNWEKISSTIDGVHLSLGGYLALAGVPIEINPGVTSLIAGWNPDETYWLTGLASAHGPITTWSWDEIFHPSRTAGRWVRQAAEQLGDSTAPHSSGGDWSG
ncbi:MAG: hypothetical protein ACP5PJ_10150 [Acidimicrobiales bacterium]